MLDTPWGGPGSGRELGQRAPRRLGGPEQTPCPRRSARRPTAVQAAGRPCGSSVSPPPPQCLHPTDSGEAVRNDTPGPAPQPGLHRGRTLCSLSRVRLPVCLSVRHVGARVCLAGWRQAPPHLGHSRPRRQLLRGAPLRPPSRMTIGAAASLSVPRPRVALGPLPQTAAGRPAPGWLLTGHQKPLLGGRSLFLRLFSPVLRTSPLTPSRAPG